jgi:hypothetical protein
MLRSEFLYIFVLLGFFSSCFSDDLFFSGLEFEGILFGGFSRFLSEFDFCGGLLSSLGF